MDSSNLCHPNRSRRNDLCWGTVIWGTPLAQASKIKSNKWCLDTRNIYLHPRKLAWNPKIVGLLFQGCILRFHINLPRYRSMIKRTNLNEDHQSDRLLCLKHLGGQGLLWDWEVSAGSNQPLSQALPINSGRFLTSMLRKVRTVLSSTQITHCAVIIVYINCCSKNEEHYASTISLSLTLCSSSLYSFCELWCLLMYALHLPKAFQKKDPKV